MTTIRTLALTLCFIVIATSPATADNLVVASGAGYKKMVNALNSAYGKRTGHTVDTIYGNMARVTTLARESGKVGLVLGDGAFLDKAGLALERKLELGRGKLVLAFAKSSQFSRLEDLDNSKAGRIALPDTRKAIYGKAAREFLLSSGRLPAIKNRLVEVATIPQVFSYLNTNEVDMGFMNLTHALNVKGKIGGFAVIDEKAHSPIRIIIAMLKNCNAKQQAHAFLAFLQTPEAKGIIREHGL